MLLSYVIAFDQLIRKSRDRSKDALGDPLDAPEWQSIAPLIEQMAGLRTRRRLKQHRDQKSDPDDCARSQILTRRPIGEHAELSL